MKPLVYEFAAMIVVAMSWPAFGAGPAAAGGGGAGPAPAPVAAPAVPSQTGLPSLQDVRKEFDAGSYRDVLRDLTRLRDSREWSSGLVDHYDLLMLRGQTFLRLKMPGPAQQAFAGAAKETRDKKKSAAAETLALLVKRSIALKYTPKPANKDDKPSAIDIVNPAGRKEALAALLKDEMKAAHAKLEAASQADSLVPILKAAPILAQLRKTELGVTGETAWTKDFAAGLAKHSHELMANALYVMHSRIDAIRVSARTMLPMYAAGRAGANFQGPPNGFRERGLDPNQLKELRNDIAACSKIPLAAKDLSESFGADNADYKDVVTQAKNLSKWAQQIQSGVFLEYSEKP